MTFQTASILCPKRDSNSHTFRRHPLKVVCLPVSPSGLNRECKFMKIERSIILKFYFEADVLEAIQFKTTR